MSKIKNAGLDQYGAEPFEQRQFGTAGAEGVKNQSMLARKIVSVDNENMHSIIMSFPADGVSLCLHLLSCDCGMVWSIAAPDVFLIHGTWWESKLGCLR